MDERGGAAAAVALSVVGGLTLAGASTAVWVTETLVRDIGDAEVADTVATRGVELSAAPLPLGIAVAVAGVLLAVPGARTRRVVGVVIALASVWGIAALVTGAIQALELPGSLTPAPGFAAVGALAALAGGVVALRGRRGPKLGPRFDIDADEAAAEDEWSVAVDPGEDDR